MKVKSREKREIKKKKFTQFAYAYSTGESCAIVSL